MEEEVQLDGNFYLVRITRSMKRFRSSFSDDRALSTLIDSESIAWGNLPGDPLFGKMLANNSETS